MGYGYVAITFVVMMKVVIKEVVVDMDMDTGMGLGLGMAMMGMVTTMPMVTFSKEQPKYRALPATHICIQDLNNSCPSNYVAFRGISIATGILRRNGAK